MPPIYESFQRNPQLNEDINLEKVHTSEQTLSDMPLIYSGFQQKQPKIMMDRLELFNTDLINGSDFVPVLKQQQENNELISMVLSMEICCVTVSKEVYSLWGYYPQELAHHSLYEFILPSDANRLSKLHRQHLEHIMEVSNSSGALITEKSTSSMFNTADEATLIQIARGSKIYSDMINIKTSLGGYELYEVVTYIGGGLGADLFDQTTLSKQYIVANFRRCQYNQEQSNTIEESVQIVLDYINPIAVFSPMSYPVTPPAINQVADDLPMVNVTHIEDDWLTHTTVTNLQESKSKQEQPSPPSSFRAPKLNTAPGTNCPINSNKFSPLFNRVTLSSKVMHPAQYFLQTSNSTLSSAASAAKSESRYSLFGSSMRHTHGISSRTRIEMSISSLLC
ncbi:hypothetical protein RO3G_15907 [Rhizopus delemar RA 99-880]|uniref:PAS domain-containing protein n=3 Tax=Rhizopus TaxID=4842 RepID=I1CRW6_RHIO9|nr:hypothetical protein RO3G_15907 [Rhizopus delemar RA 99-880]|eukprot:EIE91196.1 hypothetical protein RO3G_15907 [Rhizopus delemar RA 99-880]